MKIFWLSISIFIASTAYAEIIEIHQIKEIEEVLSDPLTNSDWVLFDIDYTLTEPENPALQMPFLKLNKQRFLDELAKFNEEQRLLVPVLMVTQDTNKLTDPLVSLLIQKLQDQHITVMGFTAVDTSTIPDIGVVPLWRSQELMRLGIIFNSNPLPQKRIEFPQFPSFRGTYPLYQDGILYSNVLPPKGEVLSAFLDEVDRKPSRIIFVDDVLENLKNVEAEMKKKEIAFLGIHYKVQANETTLPKVSDKEWKTVWNKIHERAEKATNTIEGILETSQITAIQWACQSMPENSLLIFDVGDVLLVHKDAVLNLKYRHWIKDWFDREAPDIDHFAWRNLAGIIAREAEMTLVNELLPSLINESKKHNIVMALSKFWCGSSGENSSFEKYRLDLLKNFDINLGEPFPESAGWNSDDFLSTYSEGLIQTKAPLKGPVLKAFLKQVNWIPKRLLFIDNRRDQCESIALTAKELGVPTLCIHYTEAKDHIPLLNHAIADMQLRTLVTEHRWISDEAAQQNLEKDSI